MLNFLIFTYEKVDRVKNEGFWWLLKPPPRSRRAWWHCIIVNIVLSVAVTEFVKFFFQFSQFLWISENRENQDFFCLFSPFSRIFSKNSKFSIIWSFVSKRLGMVGMVLFQNKQWKTFNIHKQWTINTT